MANLTETYWSADGESLHTYARAIQSLTGSLSVPPVRGSNIVIPYMPGSRWVPKVADERVLNLAMWLRGVEPSAGGGASGGTKQNFDTNWSNLVRLLWRPGDQIQLTKRFYEDTTLRSATALAEFSGGLAPTMIGRTAGKAVIDMRLANPFFYDDQLDTYNLVNGDQVIAVKGNAPTRRIIATINGSRKNTIIRVKSPGDDHQMEYHADLSSGDKVTIDVENYSSLTDPSAGPNFDSTVDVRHSGSPYWLILQPGNNTVNLSSESGIGSVQLQVRGAWV